MWLTTDVGGEDARTESPTPAYPHVGHLCQADRPRPFRLLKGRLAASQM